MIIIAHTLAVLMSIALFVIVSGFIFYKSNCAPTWEKGIVVLFQKISRVLLLLLACLAQLPRVIFNLIGRFQEWNRKNDISYYQENNSLVPAPVEVSALIKKLTNYPYLAPSRKEATNTGGIFRLVITSIGLVERFKGLSSEELREMITGITKEFWVEYRGTIPDFYISNVTANRFLLSMPLSLKGYDNLQKEIQQYEVNQSLIQDLENSKDIFLAEEIFELNEDDE